MKKYFITYGDYKFEYAKQRISKEAECSGQFDEIISYSPNEISDEVRNSPLFSIERGGGLWIWKPDIIYTTLLQASMGDIVVYADSGCCLSNNNKAWNDYWCLLDSHDIIPQLIFKYNKEWCRKEIFETIPVKNPNWFNQYQFCATVVILKKTEFTLSFIKEWRNIMINNPELVMDVDKDMIFKQHKCFKENRHDQSIFSALVYKYLYDISNSNRIYPIWERIEDIDFLSTQAIRAARLRNGDNDLSLRRMVMLSLKRIIKHCIYVPLYSIRMCNKDFL